MTVEKYLLKKGFKFKRRGEEAVLCCPICGEKENKFAINLITGAFNCLKLNTCGVKGSFGDLQKKLGDEPEKLNSNRVFYKPEKKRFVLPKTEVPQMEDKQVPVYQYLKSRGFSEETIKYFHIGAKENTVMFPFYKTRILTNIKHRDITDKKQMWQEKDAQPLLFNRDNIIENTLIICEGEYDCMALHQYGIEAVSVPNGAGGLTWIEQEWALMDEIEKMAAEEFRTAQEELLYLASLKIKEDKAKIVEGFPTPIFAHMELYDEKTNDFFTVLDDKLEDAIQNGAKQIATYVLRRVDKVL
jgi:twinkle protein